MTTTMTPAEQRAAVRTMLFDMEAHLQQLHEARQRLQHTLLGHNTVVGYPQYGLYASIDRQNGATVERITLGGVLSCDRFTPRDAKRLTENDNIRNGHGEAAEPQLLIHALDGAIARTNECIAYMADRLDELNGVRLNVQ